MSMYRCKGPRSPKPICQDRQQTPAQRAAARGCPEAVNRRSRRPSAPLPHQSTTSLARLDQRPSRRPAHDTGHAAPPPRRPDPRPHRDRGPERRPPSPPTTNRLCYAPLRPTSFTTTVAGLSTTPAPSPASATTPTPSSDPKLPQFCSPLTASSLLLISLSPAPPRPHQPGLPPDLAYPMLGVRGRAANPTPTQDRAGRAPGSKIREQIQTRQPIVSRRSGLSAT